MTVYQWLCILGAPVLLGAFFKYLQHSIKRTLIDTLLVKEGVQALLRAQMIQDYNKWIGRGCAPIYARENFENCWKKYHALGANGVMDDLHEKFMKLPTKEKDEKEKTK